MTSDAETALIGACLLKPSGYWEAVDEGVASQTFADLRCRRIFEAIAKSAENGGVDPILVADRLPDDRAFIHSATDMGIGARLREYARAVVEAALVRQTRRTLQEALEEGWTADQTAEALYRLERRESGTSTLQATFRELVEKFDDAPEATYGFPWRKIQLSTRGIRAGWLYYVAGPSGQGKTAFALQTIANVVFQGGRVFLGSLEMAREELALRVAQQQGLNADRYWMKRTPAEKDLLLAQSCDEKWQNVVVSEVGDVERVTQIPGHIRRHKPDLVVIDYLQLLENTYEQQHRGYEEISRALKIYARRYRTAVMAINQYNRNGEMRGSTALENDPDVIIKVSVEEPENGTDARPQGELPAEIRMAKVRHGARGKLTCLFCGRRQRFLTEDDQ